jgi:hypothetical protein
MDTLRKKTLLIDSFEGKIGADTLDFGSSANSSVKVSSSTKVSQCGSHSLQMTYHLKPSGYVYCARGYNLHHIKDSSTWATGRAGWLVHPDQIAWENFNAFSVFVRGDHNGKVAIDLRDSNAEVWRHVIMVDYKGWRRFIIPFNDFSVRKDWQPDKAIRNRIMDFPIKSFQFEPKDPGQGTLYFDCVKLLKR